MATVANETLPHIELRGTRALRGSADAAGLAVTGAGMWALIVIGLVDPAWVANSYPSFLVTSLAFCLPALSLIDLYLIWMWGRRAVINIGPEGLSNENHEMLIPWGRITQVTRKSRLLDVDAVGEKVDDWDGLVIFPHAFERWSEAESVLRFYISRNGIGNNLETAGADKGAA